MVCVRAARSSDIDRSVMDQINAAGVAYNQDLTHKVIVLDITDRNTHRMRCDDDVCCDDLFLC